MARPIHFLLVLVGVVGFADTGTVWAQEVQTDENFNRQFRGTYYIAEAKRDRGASIVTVTFRDPAVEPMDLPLRTGLTGVFTSPETGQRCIASMGVFQERWPVGGGVVGEPAFRNRKGVFMLPTVFVGATNLPVPVAAGGGTWRRDQVVRLTESRLQRGAAPERCFQPTAVGGGNRFPRQDAIGHGSVQIFGTRDQFIVHEDAPSVHGVALGDLLGITPAGAEERLVAGDTFEQRTHLATIFYVDCHIPSDRDPETVFFQVNWGFDMDLTPAATAETTTGTLNPLSIDIIVNPGADLGAVAVGNGKLWESRK